VSVISPELRRKLRAVGPYCSHCRAFCAVDELKPLKSRKLVKAERLMDIGEEVGTHWCGKSCFYLLETVE
jgi:hypothetical protein